MKAKTLVLNITGTLALSLAFVQASHAAEPGGARFSFAPNVWKQESARVPQPEHTVRDGSVPVGSKFLGLDPQMLAKPQAPQTQVAARPIITRVTPQMLPPKGEFSASFGKPEGLPSATKPQVAAPVPVVAQAKSFVPYHGHQASRHGSHATTGVHAVLALQPKTQGNGLAAAPANTIASYDKNFGYVPGSFLPASTGDGSRTETEVQGKLLHR